MYRTLNILKDSYVTNKIVNGVQSVSSSVGQAASLDLFKIWSQTVSGSTPTIENSRLLVQADLGPIRALTGSLLDFSNSSFKCFFSLKDIYGGQTTPSNFIVSLLPLAKSWDEGRGLDVVSYRDLDATNWLTASLSTGTVVPWSLGGAGLTGSLADSTVDVWISGNLGAGSQSLEVQQVFARGDEDLLMDVTTLVSATLAGTIPDNGWRLSFIPTAEQDGNSYFVKRFGSMNTTDPTLRPKLIINFDDHLEDDANQAVFGSGGNTIRTYKTVNGQYLSFASGSSSITGSNCLMLELAASKSLTITTSSWQQNFSASITYATQSMSYFSASFTGSQTLVGTLPQTGFYQASVVLDPTSNTELNTYLGSDLSAGFQTYWKSLDNTVLYSSGSFLTFTISQSSEQVVAERNFVVNVTNLKNTYTQNQTARLRVFIQDINLELPAYHVPVPSKSLIENTMYWRLLEAFSRKLVIPYTTTATRLSSDGTGMYFDLYIQDLDPNIVYEIEFQITENNQNYFITDEEFRFKVLP